MDINILLPQPEQVGASTTEKHITSDETSLSFRLEYKGSSASELSAAYLTINFIGATNQDDESIPGNEIEVRADAYQYSYQIFERKTEQITPAESSARPALLKKESTTVKIPLEDLQQLAYANRVDIKLGKKELRMRSIQLGDLRKTLIAQNAN